MHSKPVIAITLGDVCGVGPEIVARAVASPQVQDACRPLIVGRVDTLQRAEAVHQQPPLAWQAIDSPDDLPAANGVIPVYDPLPEHRLPDSVGVSANAGEAAYRYLLAAIALARQGVVDAIATAPLNKAALHAAGHNYPGHTEILAHECGVRDFAMMLHLPESRVAPLRQLIAPQRPFTTQSGVSIAHVTLHTSVKSVPGLLSTTGVQEKIVLMDAFLKDLSDERRAIGVCALNPHGGEQGLFGEEEATIIQPAVAACSERINVHGPLPVDTLIRRAVSGEFDGVVAMYHDQGHIPIKMIGFDAAVNITLGLPIIRTSPTHGTAFDRAWNAATPADSSGMQEAILTAVSLVAGRAARGD